MQTRTKNRQPAVRITVEKAMAIEARDLILARGIELNLTQAVNTLLLKGLRALRLETEAKK